MSLIIKEVAAIPVRIPLKNPIYISARAIEFAETLIVKIETENGLVGWGEAAASHRMTGDVLPGMAYITDSVFSPLLKGKDALDYINLISILEKAAYRNSGPKCAIEMALLDLVSTYKKIPLYKLLGNLERSEFSPIVILGNKNFEEDLKDAVRCKNQGINFFKIKIGVGTIDNDIEHALELRSVLGPDTDICADGNMGLTPYSAIKFSLGTADARIAFLEEPFDASEYSLDQLGIKICADEQLHNCNDIVRLSNVISGVNLKTIKFGGLLNTLQGSKIAHTYNLKNNISQKIAETSIAARAVLHLAAVVPNIDWGVSLTNQYLSDDVVHNPLMLSDGIYKLNDAVGIGVEVDEDKLNTYRQ